MPTIKAYSWHPTKKSIPGIIPMPYISPVNSGDPDATAAQIAGELGSMVLEDRALHIYGPAGYGFDQHVVKHTIKQFLLQTVDTSKTRNWYLQFYNGLRTRGIELNALIMDEESNVTNWAFQNYASKDSTLSAYLHTLWADTQVQAAMPVALRQYSIDQVLKMNGPAVIAWNNWTLGIIANMLRSIVLAPYVQVFGRTPITSNWNDLRGTFTMYDNNGWPATQQQVSDWSSPATYVGMSGNRYNGVQAKLAKDQYWNRFIDCINAIRSTMGFNAQCIPWVSYRAWLDPDKKASTQLQWLWNQLMLHAVGTGVDKFLFWNPKNATGATATDADDVAMGDFIASVAQMPLVVRQLPEVQMDADSVTTGNLTTNYNDYMTAQSLNFTAQSGRLQMRTPSRSPVRTSGPYW